ncbi:MAG TPA: Hsp20/alpha crystallin family protein [Hyphomicrobiales bacterium]|nr:Hsp20/alpha crystallin family protein [Hyphomicrobiales bacterium]
MARRDAEAWMWAEAIEMLSRAERLHGQYFRVPRSARDVPAWEPPADMYETEREVVVLVSLPGVDIDEVQAVIEDGALLVAGRRTLPAALRHATIHRMELPQGRFERRIPLPHGRYDGVSRTASDGCLMISLRKSA